MILLHREHRCPISCRTWHDRSRSVRVIRAYSYTLLPAFIHRAISVFTLLFPRGTDSKRLYATIVIARSHSPRVNECYFSRRPIREARDTRNRRKFASKGMVLRTGSFSVGREACHGKYYTTPWRWNNLINEGYLN